MYILLREEDRAGGRGRRIHDRGPSAVYQISAVNPVTRNPGARRRRIVKRKGGEEGVARIGVSARIPGEEAVIAGRVMTRAKG